MMRQPTEKKPLKGGGAQKKKPRDLELSVLEKPAEDKKLMLEMRSVRKRIVDWVNGLAKLKTCESTIATAQNLLWEWWDRGVDLRRRVADWAVHIFREHNQEADIWAGKGVKGSEEEWTDIANIIWSEVTGLCGVLEGSCERCTFGVFTQTLGCATTRKKMRTSAGPQFS